MKRIVFFAVALFVVLNVAPVSAGVNVGISIGVPPPIEFVEPPDVVVVPSGSAYVYMVPDTPGLYFYNNFWYRFYDGRWYRSSIYNGSWVYISTGRVPRFVVDVPPDYYLGLPRGYYRIHYGDLHRNWRSWDRGRHWNRYDWYKDHERRRHDEGRAFREGGHGRHDEGRGPAFRDERGPRRGDVGPRHEGGPRREGGAFRNEGGGMRHDGGAVRRDGGAPRREGGAAPRRDNVDRMVHPDKGDRDR